MEAATEAGLEIRLPPQDAVFHLGLDKHGTIGIPGGSRAIGSSGKTPSKNLLIPTFSGDIEGTGDLGTSARSYLRQMAAGKVESGPGAKMYDLLQGWQCLGLEAGSGC